MARKAGAGGGVVRGVRALLPTLVLALLAGACTLAGTDTDAPDSPDGPERAAVADLPPPPGVPDGPLAPELEAEIDEVLSDLTFLARGDLAAVGASDDVRVAWVLVDLLRFHQGGPVSDELVDALVDLTGFAPGDDAVAWVAFSDALLTWDIPAPPGYLDRKRTIFLATDPSWEPFFDERADLDWREVTWGGVSRDGIETLVDPATTAPEDAAWLEDDEIVFGIDVGGEARAYPRRILEVHEMASDTLGGRRVALSYCTLCGSPIPYVVEGVDAVDEPLELRTSGLLQRSNKLMYDVQTESLFDQFRGTAVTGPLRDAGVSLEPVPLAVTTWAEWHAEHPGTDVVDLPDDRGTELGLETYSGDLFERRDAAGPIFPTGERDERLDPQTRVLGVTTPRGVAVAFPVDEARAALEAGVPVRAGGVEVVRDRGGLVARPEGGGPELPAHEAFWFAWSQFRADTLLWDPPDR
jgi:hypothetical protein